MPNPTMVVQTPRCSMCGTSTTVEVDVDAFHKWQGGMLIQHAFPNWPIEKRELLISGMHDACWQEAFGDEDDGSPN